MANSNRVFVSPGVYTSEKDLTFVAQSVGVTTLGLAGETIQGPAFEPILIRNFDEFKTYFGPTSPAKYSDGNPKYELGYVAKSYLQESNQLFVTRVLGLTGYKPLKTFAIKTLGGITVDTTNLVTGITETLTGATTNISTSSFIGDLNNKTATDGSSVPDYINSITVQDGTWFTIGYVDPDTTAPLTDSLEETGPIGSNVENNWYNFYFKENGLGVIDGVYSYLFVYDATSTGWTITQFEYVAEVNEDYDGIVVAALRSRGAYSGETLDLEIINNGDLTLSSSTIASNPMGEFVISANGSTSGVKSFTCTMDMTSTKYITKVLGGDVFDKKRSDFPVYVFEEYPNFFRFS
jgi:hypothetical protein